VLNIIYIDVAAAFYITNGCPNPNCIRPLSTRGTNTNLPTS